MRLTEYLMKPDAASQKRLFTPGVPAGALGAEKTLSSQAWWEENRQPLHRLGLVVGRMVMVEHSFTRHPWIQRIRARARRDSPGV